MTQLLITQFGTKSRMECSVPDGIKLHYIKSLAITIKILIEQTPCSVTFIQLALQRLNLGSP